VKLVSIGDTMNNQQTFLLPNMVLTREDIKDETLRAKLTNIQMQTLADKMSKMFMNEWALTLSLVLNDVLEESN